MTVFRRNKVEVASRGATPMIFAHGYGCDQHMWRMVAPSFANDYKIVLYGLTGSGGSDLSTHDRSGYGPLQAHAPDLLDTCDALDLSNAVTIGHSVSAMTAVLAANRAPERFSSMVMEGPSPCYLNDGHHTGRVCRTDPEIAKHFGRVTFLSDHRTDAKVLKHPALVLQCGDELIAPLAVGERLNRNLERSELVVMKATGHCPHLSAPAETIVAMRKFLAANKLPKEARS